MPMLHRTMKDISIAVVLAMFMGSAGMASAANDQKPAPPRRPAPAAKPAPPRPAPARPSAPAARPGNPGGGANRPAGPGTNRPAMPSSALRTNRPAGPSANQPTGPSANHPPVPGARPGPGPACHAPLPRGSNQHVAANGSVVRTRPNGRVSDIHNPKTGMNVHNGLNGNRRISVERPDHSRIVAERDVRATCSGRTVSMARTSHGAPISTMDTNTATSTAAIASAAFI